MDALWKDFLYALRGLARRPGFTLVVMITLAIGIGANTAVFSTLHAGLLRSLPFEDPDRLVIGRAVINGGINPFASAHDYYDYREQSTSFQQLAAIAGFPIRVTVTGDATPERVQAGLVSWDLFATLGVGPAAGRLFVAEEGEPEAPDAVMISHGYWQRRFGGSQDVVGSTLSINGRPNPIVGVMPPGFRFLWDVDIWAPMQPGGPFANARRFHNWLIIGRLAEGVTLAQARQEVDAISLALQEAYPDSNRDKALQLDPLHSALAEDVGPRVLVLMAAVGLLVLIACGNVANLLLARGSTRRGELAVRTALGASRGSLVRLVLSEALVLAVGGGALGVFLAQVLQGSLPAATRLEQLGIDKLELSTPVLLFAVVFTLLTGLLAGVFPALRGARVAPSDDLRGSFRGASASSGARLRSGLVIAQVTLSCVLLVASGLLLRSFVQLVSSDVGFDADNLLTGEVQLPYSKYNDDAAVSRFYDQLKEDLEAIPAVSSVAMISQLPLRDPGNNIYVWLPESPPSVTGEKPRVAFTRTVMPGYFQAMGLPILAGRGIERGDTGDAQFVMVINSAMSERLFGEDDPLGRQVAVDMGDEDPVVFQVVGVAGDARLTWIGSTPRMAMYHSYYQVPQLRMRFAVRTGVDAAAVASAVREAVWRQDRDIPVEDMASMRTVIRDSVVSQRMISAGVALFAAVALLLAAVGLYGVLAYHVNQRYHEIGIRMAIGGSPGTIFRQVAGRGMLLALIGIGVGLTGAAAAGRLLTSLLFGISPVDPLVFVTVPLVLGAAALLACIVPARRASFMDPMTVLRQE